MFRSVTLGCALTFLSEDAKATKLTYRPTPGAAPWYDSSTVQGGPTWKEPTWPVNYWVPNFGMDKEIIESLGSTKATEEEAKHEIATTFDKPKAPPRDYFVPNFGVDHDVAMTDLNIGEAETQHGHVLQVEEKAKGNPQNYFVPNFGKDNEIVTTEENLNIAEKKLDHHWEDKSLELADPHPTNYFVPNFGMDNEIASSLANTQSTEKNLGHKWEIKEDAAAVQLDADIQVESDPICSSAGCGQYAHPAPPKGPPMDYPVPNFGPDPENANTMNSIAIAEKMNNHKLIMGTPESKAKWHTVAKDTLYDYHPALDKDVINTNRHIAEAEDKLGVTMDVQLHSDPIGSSIGITEYALPKGKKSHPMDYFVPNFGTDKDMLDQETDLAVAEKEVGHKFEVKEAEKGAAKDYKVPNFGQDQEIADSLANTKDAEATLEHKWEMPKEAAAVQIESNVESDPICSSSGCGQYAHPAPPAGPPMDYPVPSYGKDPDMVGTLNSLSISEKMNNHKLIMGTPESKAKWHTVAKDTLYDYHPALDKDVITTNRNIDAAEDLLGKQM